MHIIRKCHPITHLTLLTLVGCAQPSLTDESVLSTSQPIIYGNDDRLDIYQVTNQFTQSDANSVAAIFDYFDLTGNPSTVTDSLSTMKYQTRFNLCSSERFTSQPTGSFCTGFLASNNILVTAGHCVNPSQLDALAFVFGFRMADATTAVTTVPASEVYFASALLGRQYDATGADWAAVVLDRPVSNHPYLPIRRAGTVANNASLNVLGHPNGLPLKSAAGAHVRANTASTYFESNLDVNHGNSGSPVIDLATHMVEGVLVRGEDNFVPNGTCYVSQTCADSGCSGIESTRTTEFASLIPVPSHHLVFRGTDGHAHELYESGGAPWVNHDLTALSGGGVAPSGDLFGYVSGQTQHVVFRGTDGHAHDLYESGGAGWVNNDLTATFGGVGPAGDVTGYVFGQTSHVLFRGTDGHAHELYARGSTQANNDLTVAAGGVGPAGDLFGYTFGNSHHIVFRGTDGHVHELYATGLPGAVWINNDLTAVVGGVGASGDVFGYTLGITSHIVFRGTDGHVHELYASGLPGAVWINNDLTAVAGGVGPSGDVFGYTFGNTQHLVFRGTDGHVHELYTSGLPGAVWNNNDLTVVAGGIGAGAVGGGVFGYMSGSASHLLFLGSDAHLHELYEPGGSGWINNDLTAVVGGVAPAGNVFGYLL